MITTVSNGGERAPICISIGVLAWNEEEAIGTTLQSLFQQSLFAQLKQRSLRCEVICVVNGCTDQTPVIAAKIFQEQMRQHPDKDAFSCRV